MVSKLMPFRICSLTTTDVQAALRASMVSQAQQYHHPQVHTQMHHATNMQTTQVHHNTFTQNYTTQPPRQDPWNGQAPARSPITPRSGGVIFDPMTDTVNYSEYPNLNSVESWRLNYTDPNYLLSPSEQVPPPQETF